MFSEGQLIFALVFIVVFVGATIWVYRRDASLHKTFYKGSYRVLIAFLLFVAFLFFIKGYLKH
ncbi:hypothetical protein [Flavobacterium silvaticum]|uniref:Uncharacterized protein n=1 Tax=Flavobacterium silvaticum TaxID=1852020 RepID=A0A972FSR8_9FLAO|nr:hypothetical protein [Flavobacterium silvaticum]NMH27322.1 hypothetical protein [Flavobacterium silvaticum]